MNRLVLGLLAITLISGCVDPATEVETVTGSTGTANAPVETQQPAAQGAVTEPASETTVVAPSVDAEQLLATTLADAKVGDKRVLVHLGAPW